MDTLMFYVDCVGSSEDHFNEIGHWKVGCTVIGQVRVEIVYTHKRSTVRGRNIITLYLDI